MGWWITYKDEDNNWVTRLATAEERDISITDILDKAELTWQDVETKEHQLQGKSYVTE